MPYCIWDTSKIALDYHNNEWGIPLNDDIKHFEYLSMEVMQCGLSWKTILLKRQILNLCFDNFDYEKVSKFTDKHVEKIMNTAGMIKSIKKIEAIINNAKCFLNIKKDYGSFSNYIWSFTENKVLVYKKHQKGSIPAKNELSIQVSNDLKKYGFKFLGPVVLYSYLQACGIINDHDEKCDRYNYIVKNYDVKYID